jgi:hypothetical protein
MLERPELELPPEVARAFVEDMRAFFAEDDAFKRDTIAVRQLRTLQDYRLPLRPRLRLDDVKRLFEIMRERMGR